MDKKATVATKARHRDDAGDRDRDCGVAETGRSKWAVLFTVLIMTFMVTLDSSIVNVALPVMQKALGVGLDQIQWVSSVYLLTMCAFLLVFGRLGDLSGKVRYFEVGVVVFSAGSLLCGISTTLPALVLSRMVQGIGGASAMANNMGIITEAFPSRERGRALGLLASFVALGMMCGPVLGGFIVSVLPWEYIFLINVPVGIASVAIGRHTLPKDAVRSNKERMDTLGALLLVPGMLLTFLSATMLQGDWSWRVLVSLGAGVLMLALFVRHERRVDCPLVHLGIFRDRRFVINLACLFISFVAIGVYELMTPFYLQDARGFDPGTAGLIFCAIPLANAIAGPISGAVSDRIGCELPCVLGLGAFSVGLYLTGTLGMESSVPQILMFLALASFGTSIFQSPNNSLVMGSVPIEMLGFAGSASALARYLGMAVGISGSTSILYGRMSAVAGRVVTSYVEGRPDIFLSGYHMVYVVTAALVAFGFCLTVYRGWEKRRR